jgi:hypothetical protein
MLELDFGRVVASCDRATAPMSLYARRSLPDVGELRTSRR